MDKLILYLDFPGWWMYCKLPIQIFLKAALVQICITHKNLFLVWSCHVLISCYLCILYNTANYIILNFLSHQIRTWDYLNVVLTQIINLINFKFLLGTNLIVCAFYNLHVIQEALTNI